jgi:hypothetical protein
MEDILLILFLCDFTKCNATSTAGYLKNVILIYLSATSNLCLIYSYSVSIHLQYLLTDVCCFITKAKANIVGQLI